MARQAPNPPNPAGLGIPRCLSGCSLLQADGSVSCQRTDCVETCPYPIRIPGQCCPDCSAGKARPEFRDSEPPGDRLSPSPRRLHLHGEDLFQQRDLPVGAGSLPELHLPGEGWAGHSQRICSSCPVG